MPEMANAMIKKTTRKSTKKPAVKKAAAKPALLSGGNPQIPKGEGDAPVHALEAERQAALAQRVVTEQDLAVARSTLDGIDHDLATER